MTETATKNSWIVDLDEYTPILVTTEGKVVAQAPFSLAEEGTDSGDRLKQLLNFICEIKGRLEDCFPGLTALMPFGVTHRVAEELVYLAYWKNQRLEFHMDKAGHEVVVWVCFPNQPELNCVLDRFIGGMDPCSELQGWLDFFCTIIWDHLEIWQIDLVVHESVYEKLAIPDPANIFIEVQAGEFMIIDDGHIHPAKHNVPSGTPAPSG